ncbi:LacI family DNA-binding transcriptional regulator [Carboxydocella sp. ULO1]|uniref:LacI family DNA-binding transcriptional regulator n=2 Tax=unclassified Carboxydocella TaxID=2685367 RepID=UPI0009AF0DCD|nr:LacI family DNA-binding transcriptional regulator [Carboxydocella sp. ULO1]GAW29434.1 LacI family transcriptional regulator [Carboxydocella sp. ULO1]
MPVTIKDVAREAGVSVSTVSRVLNNSKPVSSEIRARVLAAVNKLNFQPNSLARSLVLKKTRLIGVLVPDIANPFFPVAIAGIEEIASMYGYNILLFNTFGQIEKELQYLNILKEKQVDGIIKMSTQVTEKHEEYFASTSIPMVVTSNCTEREDVPCVVIDDVRAAYDATSYLISLGHKRIGMISGPLDDSAGRDRFLGYQQAMLEHKLNIDFNLLKQGNFKVESGKKAMEEILRTVAREELPTAIFAANDEMAIGAIGVLLDNGLRVPEDISVMGFDDIFIAPVFRPALTTVKQPIYDIGAVAARKLVKLIEGEKLSETKTVLPYHIIERNSCRRI